MKKVLLHICCAGCAVVCINRLREDNYYTEGFFFNPNIHPRAEYERRVKDILFLSKELNINIDIEEYRPFLWFEELKQYKDLPEKSLRCQKCFVLRFKGVYDKMLKKNFDYFSTTLSISPYKDFEMIKQAGVLVGNARFLDKNFKKQDGFKQAGEYSRKYNFYKQNYCGCVYSLIDRKRR